MHEDSRSYHVAIFMPRLCASGKAVLFAAGQLSPSLPSLSTVQVRMRPMFQSENTCDVKTVNRWQTWLISKAVYLH
jgi:hypothetical protein